jgi:hypothetical protein
VDFAGADGERDALDDFPISEIDVQVEEFELAHERREKEGESESGRERDEGVRE